MVRRYWSSLALIVIGVVWLVGGAVAMLGGKDGPQPPVVVLALGAAAVLVGVVSAVVRARARTRDET